MDILIFLFFMVVFCSPLILESLGVRMKIVAISHAIPVLILIGSMIVPIIGFYHGNEWTIPNGGIWLNFIIIATFSVIGFCQYFHPGVPMYKESKLLLGSLTGWSIAMTAGGAIIGNMSITSLQFVLCLLITVSLIYFSFLRGGMDTVE